MFNLLFCFRCPFRKLEACATIESRARGVGGDATAQKCAAARRTVPENVKFYEITTVFAHPHPERKAENSGQPHNLSKRCRSRALGVSIRQDGSDFFRQPETRQTCDWVSTFDSSGMLH
jgi:hypothetical protein